MVYPRPQFWFEQLVVNRYQDHLWREHFRVSRNTFEHICGLVGPELVRQNTILRQAISVEKRVAVALWRLATGNSYRTVGLTFGIGRCTAMNVKDEFCTALLRRANDFIKFPKTEAETRQSIQEFQDISRFPQVVTMWQRNLVWKNCWLPVMRELILHADAVKQVRPWMRDLSIQRVRRNYKTAKELGSVLQFVSHV